MGVARYTYHSLLEYTQALHAVHKFSQLARHRRMHRPRMHQELLTHARGKGYGKDTRTPKKSAESQPTEVLSHHGTPQLHHHGCGCVQRSTRIALCAQSE